MSDAPSKIKLFESNRIRSQWDDEAQTWWFSVVDVIGALTESTNPTDYLKKLRKRDALLGSYLGTNCPQVAMQTESGKLRKTLAASTEQLLRIVQSIPSPKAEPFKLWLAQVGSERLDETADPELSIDRAVQNYQRMGYSEQWINMTNTELVLNMLAEVAATDIAQVRQPQGFAESAQTAQEGAQTAKAARLQLEKSTGRKVVSKLNAKQLGTGHGNEGGAVPDASHTAATKPKESNS